MNNISEKDKYSCCGCTACQSICPHNAITMQPDSMGFLYPKVNGALCTDCGLCSRVCEFHSEYDKSHNLPTPKVYALRHKDLGEVAKSQSGAAFFIFSEWILRQGGVVYGVGYTDHFRAVHKRAETKEQRDEFRRSKYVQSDVSTAFIDAKQDLQAGRIVLFSGTPCQVAGLKKYVGRKLQNNLYTIDIVCHGVCAPFVWRDYLAWMERKKGKKVVKVDFRDKNRFGWKSHKETFIYEGDTYTYTYTYMFYQHINLRHCCAKCPFTNTQRVGDVTVGDYWGLARVNPYFANDNKGCSLVFLNTPKALQWFDSVKAIADYIESDLTNCLQPQLQHPITPHKKREQYEADFIKHGFPWIAYHYGDMGWRYYVRTAIKATKEQIVVVMRKMGLR